MDLDLETCLTALYVIVDDLYQSHIRPQMPCRGGPQAERSDSEALCLGLAAQWRSGVPWHTERGVLRYVRKHLQPLCPTLLSQSAFNRRLRRLWGAYILIQDAVAEPLSRTEALDNASHGVVPDGGVVLDWRNPPGSAVNTRLDSATSALRAEPTATRGVLHTRH